MSPYLEAFILGGEQPPMVFINPCDPSLEESPFRFTVNPVKPGSTDPYYAIAASSSLVEAVRKHGFYATIRGRFNGPVWNGFRLAEEANRFGLDFCPKRGYSRRASNPR